MALLYIYLLCLLRLTLQIFSLCLRSLCCTMWIMFLSFVSYSVRPFFRPVPNIFISLRKNTERISKKMQEVINTANRLNNYILGEIGIEARDARKFESTSAGV